MSLSTSSLSDWTLLASAAQAVADQLDDIQTRDSLLPPPLASPKGPIITTGIGLSGGPARYLSAQLTRLGYTARFAGLSEIWLNSPRAEAIICFSQSFAGNARLVQSASASKRVIFTSAPPQKLSWFDHVVHIPQDEHHNCQVHLQSPVTSLYAALRWLALSQASVPWSTELNSVPNAARAAFQPLSVPPDILSTPIVFLSAWYDPSELHQLAWKWAETIFHGPPLITNALEFAHGPLQVIYNQRATIISLSHPNEKDIWTRVKSVLDPQRHHYVEVNANLPPPLSFWEFDATLNATLLELLKQTPECLNHHPTLGLDAPLYTFDGD
ncbi:MAG: hypothetical protein KTR25_00005 [Myxococcales bacterium]|nr:hypothetical protein [Myxococcales bacterium]